MQKRSFIFCWRYCLPALMLLSEKIVAQQFPDTLIDLRGALQQAEQRYPLLKAKHLEAEASAKYTDVVKHSLITNTKK